MSKLSNEVLADLAKTFGFDATGRSKEMEKLISNLKRKNIKFKVRDHWSGTKQVVILDGEEKVVADAISYYGSYGGEYGLIEVWWEDGDEDPVGWLSSKEAFRFLINKERERKRAERKMRYNHKMRKRNAM